jgi:hypothetical protein
VNTLHKGDDDDDDDDDDDILQTPFSGKETLLPSSLPFELTSVFMLSSKRRITHVFLKRHRTSCWHKTLEQISEAASAIACWHQFNSTLILTHNHNGHTENSFLQ